MNLLTEVTKRRDQRRLTGRRLDGYNTMLGELTSFVSVYRRAPTAREMSDIAGRIRTLHVDFNLGVTYVEHDLRDVLLKRG